MSEPVTGTDHRPGTPYEHWRWRASPVAAGPAVVFDIDGVLADATERQHLLEARGRDRWTNFFAEAGSDAVIEELARLAELIDPALVTVLLTARPTSIRDITITWLERHGLRWDLLVMRPEGVYLSSPDAKRLAVHELQSFGFDLRLAIDDDRRNVDMFHAEGVPCIYIHSGYYEG